MKLPRPLKNPCLDISVPGIYHFDIETIITECSRGMVETIVEAVVKDTQKRLRIVINRDVESWYRSFHGHEPIAVNNIGQPSFDILRPQ